MNAEWENFVASLDVSAVERERFRVFGPLDHERPGSRWDHEMRAEHSRTKRARVLSPSTDLSAMQVVDANRFIASHGGRVVEPRQRAGVVSDAELDRRFAAYRASHGGRAA